MDNCIKEKERLRSLWHKYVLTGNIVPDPTIRPEIFSSWHRCQEAGVDPLQKKVPRVLDKATLARQQAKAQRLIEVAEPVIENLYRFVAGSNFVVVLADAEGYVLKITGDPETVAAASQGNLCLGADWGEAVAGTNGIGTCLATKKPLQIFSYEHYCICSHKWCCSGAPIFNHEGHLLGAIDMTGPFDKVHSHTLGMVVAAADAIKNQFTLREALIESEESNEFKAAVLETVSDGLMVIDHDGCIMHLNAAAAFILELKTSNVIGKNVCELLKPHSQLLGIINNDSKYINELEVEIRTSKKYRRYLVTCRIVRQKNNEILGKVIILKSADKIKKVAQRMIGAQAYYTFDHIIGENPRFQQTIELGRVAARNSSTVLLMGESGTGKELFAHSIHNASSRNLKPFVVLNCAAVPRELLASELFGYVEGAFTGARKSGRPGKFELAEGGTLFLDEIGEMPLELQVMLLRVLEERSVVRIGGDRVISVDVRIIAATNRNLWAAVEQGRFRRDLFYRLNVIVIEMIPLRNRKDDIPLLCQAFLSRSSARLGKDIRGLEPEVEDLFARYSWPGNIRELSNVIEYAAARCNGQLITTDDLPVQLVRKEGDSLPQEPAGLTGSLVDIEQELIKAALYRHNGNKSKAAEELGIARSTLYRKMKKEERLNKGLRKVLQTAIK